MLTLENVRKKFGTIEVLKGITFHVNQGDVIAILGPSGSGKTTLLRCLNFLEKADSGMMIFNGERWDMNRISRKNIALIRKKTAFVFQDYNLFFNKTVLQNVTEGLIIARKIPKKQAIAIGEKALEKVGLKAWANYYPRQLSGGQQQRVAIARALVTEPEIIFFDEPTSALDPELTEEIMAIMHQLAEEGRTMLIVTHEMQFAQNISSKVIFMEQGQLIEMGDAQEIFSYPREERTKNFLYTSKII